MREVVSSALPGDYASIAHLIACLKDQAVCLGVIGETAASLQLFETALELWQLELEGTNTHTQLHADLLKVCLTLDIHIERFYNLRFAFLELVNLVSSSHLFAVVQIHSV